MNPGIYPGLSNEDYHASEGISKSGLELFKKSPALLEWSRNCPEDDAVMAADFGDALHARLLEPDRFKREYVAEPKFDRRTTKGKEGAAEFEAENKGKTILTADDAKKLELMHGSAMAHPTARWLLEAAGAIEESYYWIDPVTGELCKTRRDKRLHDYPILVDVKSCDDLGRFSNAVEDYGYWLQDGMYSEGYEDQYGEVPGFLFLAIQTTRSLNRYPCAVLELIPENKAEGREEFRRLIDSYHDAKVRQDFPGVQSCQRPNWRK